MAQFRSFRERLVRIGSLSALWAVGASVRIGIEKLLVVPLLVYVIGEEAVGSLVLLLGWSNLLGLFPAGGSSDSVMRMHAEVKKAGDWPTLLTTSIISTAGLSFLMLVIAGIALAGTGTLTGPPGFYIMGIGIGLRTVFMAGRVLMMTNLRLALRFKTIAVIQVVSGFAMLVAIPLAMLAGLGGAGMGFALAAAAIWLWTFSFNKGMFRGHPLFSMRMARKLAGTMPLFALVSALSIGFTQASRLAVGYFEVDRETVTIYYAAESMATLLIVPFQFIAGTVYSVISRRERADQLSRGMLWQLFAVSLVGSGLVFTGIRLLGYHVLGFFYPSVADSAWPLLQILSYGAASVPLFFVTRGFVLRFCSFRRIATYSALNVTVLLGLLIYSVPRFGLVGAAWSLSAANIFVAVLWFGTFTYLFALRRGKGLDPRNDETSPPPADADSGAADDSEPGRDEPR